METSIVSSPMKTRQPAGSVNRRDSSGWNKIISTLVLGIRSARTQCCSFCWQNNYRRCISSSRVKSQNSNNIQSMENECLHHTSLLNSRKATALTLSRMCIASTRQKRCNGTRKRVAASTVIPNNWKDFLCVDVNKSELFAFLSRKVVRLTLAEGKELYATVGSGVCSPAESYCTRLLHGRKSRPTLVYFCMRQMLCKSCVRRWPYTLLILLLWYWLWLHSSRMLLMSFGLPLASG